MPPAARRVRRVKDTIVGRLRAADPFELIRWLARSQPDPRKALAELVQNSIDAGGRRIRISRSRDRGVVSLHVLDDGEGVIPELSRTEALRYIATHIGHSRKRRLTPEQRRELMLQGKYGIGLLGFWAIGRLLEMRTQLPGQPAYLLRMFEDSPRYEVERMRSRLSLGDRYTEVVIRELHRPAFLSLTARRIADYLATELRGQLLSHEPEIYVHDRMARGRAPKVRQVQAARFSGQRLSLPEEIPVESYTPIRVELYLLPSADAAEGKVSISCGGTTVYEDVTQFDVVDLQRRPWTDRRLTGLLEFPDFQVVPGTRRGVYPDRAALAFAGALGSLELSIIAQIEEVEAQAAAVVETDMLRQLERAFRDLPRLAPQYDFFAVRAPRTKRLGGAPAERQDGPRPSDTDAAAQSIPAGAPLPNPSTFDEEAEEPPGLLAAGPLQSAQIVPAETKVERLGQRRLRVEAYDASGIRIRRPLRVDWSVWPTLGSFEPEAGSTTIFQAGPDTGAATIAATVRDAERWARTEAKIDIVEVGPTDETPHAGIPEAIFIHEPASIWRSRMREGRWEVNSGHPDFHAASEAPRRKLRYLATLLAKEVVLYSFPSPQLDLALERLVEVMTITERRLERG